MFLAIGPALADTVALWLFDEPAGAPNRALLEDWTINGSDLTLNQGARITAGRFGNCLEIMGGGGRTAIRRYIDPSPLNLGDFDWTWETWVRLKAAARPGDIIFELRRGPFDKGPKCGLAAGETPAELVFVCEAAGIERQTLKTNADVLRGADDSWHHLAITYESSLRRLTHWVDGKKLDSVVLASPLKSFASNGENNLAIGADINGWHAFPAFFDEMRVSKTVVYRGDFAPPASFAPAAEPIALGPGPRLFIDDALIDKSENLKRVTHQPKRLPEPILRQRKIRDGWEQQWGSLSVEYDSSRRIYRLWANVKNVGFEEPDFYATTYWESDDGVHWREPELGVIEFGGSRKHNVIMTGRTHNIRFHVGILDEGPDAADPSRRYKIAYFPLDWRQDHTNGLNVGFSADGIHWKAYEGNPVLRHWDVTEGRPGCAVSVADINDIFFDKDRKLYVQTYKTYALPGEYPMAAGKRDGRWREINDKVPGYRRIIGLCTSEDFVHWTNLQRVMMPDDLDTPELQFYSMSLIKRGDLYIGHVRCLDDQAEADGTGWMELATSRDLYHWTRHRDVFFDRNRKPGQWDSAICWHARPIIVGDEMWFYFSGLGGGHKSGERHIGLARMRLDGYVSRDAGASGGVLRTRLLIPNGQGLTVNAVVKGQMLVRVLDKAGKPLPGFDWTDCRPIKGDSTAHTVNWKGSFAALRGRPVRLEFRLRDAQLYGFGLSETAGASGGKRD